MTNGQGCFTAFLQRIYSNIALPNIIAGIVFIYRDQSFFQFGNGIDLTAAVVSQTILAGLELGNQNAQTDILHIKAMGYVLRITLTAEGKIDDLSVFDYHIVGFLVSVIIVPISGLHLRVPLL